MNAPPALIDLVGITKTYGHGQASLQALGDVNLRIEEGEFVAITGPSGSGKSTMMNIVGCLDTPTSGAYLFRGVHVERLSRNERALLRRHYLGFVFQGYNLIPRTTALENVELPLLYRSEPAAARREAARRALAAVGLLAGWETHTPAELSGGQQQRVAIARAIVTRPAVLLADEPTGNLDTQRGREIMELISALHHDGITVVMVTHEADIAAYAQRIIRFVDGGIESDVKTADEKKVALAGSR